MVVTRWLRKCSGKTVQSTRRPDIFVARTPMAKQSCVACRLAQPSPTNARTGPLAGQPRRSGTHLRRTGLTICQFCRDRRIAPTGLLLPVLVAGWGRQGRWGRQDWVGLVRLVDLERARWSPDPPTEGPPVATIGEKLDGRRRRATPIARRRIVVRATRAAGPRAGGGPDSRRPRAARRSC